jgi:hypothetical protein
MPPYCARQRAQDDSDTEMAQHLGEIRTLVQQPIALAQLADDLLGCVSLPLHRDVLLPSMLDVGLSRHADHYPGVPSAVSPRV